LASLFSFLLVISSGRVRGAALKWPSNWANHLPSHFAIVAATVSPNSLSDKPDGGNRFGVHGYLGSLTDDVVGIREEGVAEPVGIVFGTEVFEPFLVLVLANCAVEATNCIKEEGVAHVGIVGEEEMEEGIVIGKASTQILVSKLGSHIGNLCTCFRGVATGFS